MDSNLLDYYNRELAYLREMGPSSLRATLKWQDVLACAALTWRTPMSSG